MTEFMILSKLKFPLDASSRIQKLVSEEVFCSRKNGILSLI